MFSSSFLSPLEDTDTCFKLEVEHLNLRRYLEMLKSSEFRDDLDVVSAVPTPKGLHFRSLKYQWHLKLYLEVDNCSQL